MSDTLFGHLALRFGEHPENLATEALGYVLRRSAGARDGLVAQLKALGAQVPSALAFRNQKSADEGGVPDIVGIDEQGVIRVILEAKFWAGLTKNQPVGYIGQLPDKDGLLLFVAPAQRQTMIWAELKRRCIQDKIPFAEQAAPAAWRLALVAANRRLALASWQSLLTVLSAEADRKADAAACADLAQLKGLCDQVDLDAFLPVRPEELTSSAHRRVLDFALLVEPIVDQLVAEKVAERDGRLTHGAVWSSYKLKFTGVAGVEVNFCSDVWSWMLRAPTPFWLKVDGVKRHGLQTALAPLDAVSRRVFDDGGAPYVALFVPVGVEKTELVEKVVGQVKEIALLAAKA